MQAGNVLKNQHILYPLRRDETALYLASCLLCKYIHPTIHPVYAKWLHRFDCIVTFFHQSEWWGWAFLCYCSCNIESSPVIESPLSFWPFNMKFRLSRIAGLVWLNQWTERGRIFKLLSKSIDLSPDPHRSIDSLVTCDYKRSESATIVKSDEFRPISG